MNEDGWDGFGRQDDYNIHEEEQVFQDQALDDDDDDWDYCEHCVFEKSDTHCKLCEYYK